MTTRAERAELLFAFGVVAGATCRLNAARYTQFGTETERAEYKDASQADLAANKAMIDAIYALKGIPA